MNQRPRLKIMTTSFVLALAFSTPSQAGPKTEKELSTAERIALSATTSRTFYDDTILALTQIESLSDQKKVLDLESKTLQGRMKFCRTLKENALACEKTVKEKLSILHDLIAANELQAKAAAKIAKLNEHPLSEEESLQEQSDHLAQMRAERERLVHGLTEDSLSATERTAAKPSAPVSHDVTATIPHAGATEPEHR